MKRLIAGGTVVTDGKAFISDVCMEHGKIIAVGENLPQVDCEVYDASGCYVLPGFIDAHTHLDMSNGVTVTCDDFDSGTRGAVCGGTTTLIDFATQDKGGTLLQALDSWHKKAAGKSHCDYAFHMAITDWNPVTASELPKMTAEGVTSYKLYFAYDSLRVNDKETLEILAAAGAEGALVGNHCENGDATNYLTARLLAQGSTAPKFHPISRPDYLESEAVSRFCALGRAAGVPVHIVHLSSQAGLGQVRTARENGQTVLVETCPQYLVLDESAYSLPDFEGAKYVCAPPLRKKADQTALWDALSHGEIQTVSTDHCAFLFDGQKTLGRDSFAKIPGGIPGLAYRPQLLYTCGVATGRFSLNRFVELLSENVARQFGLFPQKGCIRTGSDADVVVWNPQHKGTLTVKSNLHNCDYTPYEGIPVTGQAQTVFLRGEPVAEQQTLVKSGAGIYVPRRNCF